MGPVMGPVMGPPMDTVMIPVLGPVIGPLMGSVIGPAMDTLRALTNQYYGGAKIICKYKHKHSNITYSMIIRQSWQSKLW